MKKNRAFLKWAGGKYPLLDDIKRHLPKGECLVEPFVGAGSVFLNTDFSRYILADINSDLISLYNIVKMRTDEYVQAARELFVPETNCAEVYYQFREEFNKSQDPFRRAVLFLYLNRYGYNGLCRYNLRGEFNVPFGRYKKPYFPEAELYHFAEKAQNAFFYCESYADSMARADDASVVYCDPPYAPLSATANFTAYHTNSFTLEQQAHLAEIAEGLVERHIPVLISNHDTMLTREWYQRAKLHVVKVRRTISRNAGTRKKRDELLAFYKEGLNKVGWNNYTRINIAFDNEVVCTRKDGVLPLQPVIKSDSLKLGGPDEQPISEEDVATAETVKPVKPVAPAKPAASKPVTREKPKAQKPKPVKKEHAAAPARQPKAVYKPGNKSVNTSKKQKTP